MKNKVLIALAIVLFFAGAFLIKVKSAGYVNTSLQTANEGRTSGEPRTDSQGEVTVTVEPVNVSEKSGDWKFKITTDTHSTELDYDPRESVVLINANGGEIKPTSYEGDPPGGHHRTGAVLFPHLDPYPQTITVVVKGVGGIERRTFSWNLYK